MMVNRAIVCDDDALVRSVVGRVMTDAGYDVVSEAESPEEALRALKAAEAGIIVLDLALRGGHGEDLLRAIGSDHPDVEVVVFSAFSGDPFPLLEAGARAVVDKPDFAELERVLSDLLSGAGSSSDRRRPAPRTFSPLPPVEALTISGLEPQKSFLGAVDALTPGDAVLALDVVPGLGLDPVWDEVFTLDSRLALARVAASTRRGRDRVSLGPHGIPVMLIVAGHPEAPGAVYDRLEQLWRREFGSGVPVAAFGHVLRDRSGREIIDAAVHSLTTTARSAATALRMV